MMYKEQGFNQDTVSILMQSWRTSTKNQYRPFLKRWLKYAQDNNFSPCNPNIQEPLSFLTELFKEGLSYNQINTASSALSSLINYGNVSFGKTPVVKRFMKGVFESRPFFP